LRTLGVVLAPIVALLAEHARIGRAQAQRLQPQAMETVDQRGGAGEHHPLQAVLGQQTGHDDDDHARAAGADRRQVADFDDLVAHHRALRQAGDDLLHRSIQVLFEKQRLLDGQARAADGAQLLLGIVQAEQVGHEAADPRPVRLVETLADELLESLPLCALGLRQPQAGTTFGIAAERQRKTAVPIGMTHGTPPLVCLEGEYRQRVLMNPEAWLKLHWPLSRRLRRSSRAATRASSSAMRGSSCAARAGASVWRVASSACRSAASPS